MSNLVRLFNVEVSLFLCTIVSEMIESDEIEKMKVYVHIRFMVNIHRIRDGEIMQRIKV